MFKFKNFSQIKTTILAILGGVLVVAGLLWPDKINVENSEAINTYVDQILIAIGGLIETLTLIFGAKDG